MQHNPPPLIPCGSLTSPCAWTPYFSVCLDPYFSVCLDPYFSVCLDPGSLKPSLKTVSLTPSHLYSKYPPWHLSQLPLALHDLT